MSARWLLCSHAAAQTKKTAMLFNESGNDSLCIKDRGRAGGGDGSAEAQEKATRTVTELLAIETVLRSSETMAHEWAWGLIAAAVNRASCFVA